MKKVILGFLAFVILFLIMAFLWLRWSLKKSSEVTIHQDVDIATLFESRCGVCHNGGSPEAPLTASLKLLPQQQILSAMTTGVMQNQAMTLSEDQQIAISKYISEIDESQTKSDVIKGMCAEETTEDYLNNEPKIDDWGIGNKNHRYYSKDVRINASNVADLKLDWAFAFPNASRARVQPTIAGNTLFTASQIGKVYALDRHTGCIRWTFQADAEIRSALVIGRDSMGRAETLYFGDFGAQVYALDLVSKKLKWKVEIDEHPLATITGSLAAFDNQLFIPVSSTEILAAVDPNYECCTFRGAMVSLDKETGKMVWKTHTIEEEPSPHCENDKGATIMAPSGAPIWTGVTIDEKRRCLYIGTGENYTRPTTTTSDAIIAFALDDGEILWSQQTMTEDAWNGACVTLTSRDNCPENSGPDADFGAPPILINRNGKDIILAGQKSSYVYAMDPDDNGKIIWETLVSRGGTMGGIHWGMATDEETLYVPINDRGLYDIHQDVPKRPGLHAINIDNGKVMWSTIEEDRCPPLTLRGCGPGLSAAITLIPEVVMAGTLDGYLKAYDSSNGKELWQYDAKREYESVNGAKAIGGAIDSDGPIVVENQMFINSGYAKFAEKEGNVLLAFSVGN